MASIEKQLKIRIAILGDKLISLTSEALKWKRWLAPFGKGGLRRHHRKMTEMSMNATRKKIWLLKQKLLALQTKP